MFKLIFTNIKNQSVEWFAPPYHLSKVEGLGEVEADIQLQKAPFQNGSTYIDTNLKERPITVELTIRGKDPEEVSFRRNALASILNPLLGLGELLYINGKTVRRIKAVAESSPYYPDGQTNRGNQFQKTLINLVCPSPFWEELNPQIVKLEDFVSNFRFPFSFPVRFATRGDSRVLINSGDVPTPVTVTFRGEATNPKITNLDTGEFIKVNRHIPGNYQLIIDTKFGNKTVKIVAPDGVEMNAMGYIDLDSSFFQLGVGENRFSFITDGGKPEVFVQYKNMYLGV